MILGLFATIKTMPVQRTRTLAAATAVAYCMISYNHTRNLNSNFQQYSKNDLKVDFLKRFHVLTAKH